MVGRRLRQLDLNLLITLDALLTERNVTRAGERLAISQSAMSGHLARLREFFDDPLLAHVGNRMEPTPRALEIHASVKEILNQLGQLVEAGGFDPSKVRRQFLIAAPDEIALLLLPALLEQVSSMAPGILLLVVDPHNFERQLRMIEQVDLWVIASEGRHDFDPYFSRRLGSDKYVCATWAGHRAIKDRVTIDQYLNLRHVLFHPPSGATFCERYIRSLGIERSLAATVENALVVPLLLKGTPCLTTVTKEMARVMSKIVPLKTLELPFQMPPLDVEMVWSPRVDKDPASVWLRELIATEIWPYGVAREGVVTPPASVAN